MTFVQQLTADASGPIAVLRVSGPEAVTIVDRLFRPIRGKCLQETPVGRPRLGRIGAGTGDEVVVLLVNSSGNDASPDAEIQCHGGRAVVEMIVRTLSNEGIRPLATSENYQTLVPSKLNDLANRDLAHAQTDQTAAILLDQANGAFDQAIVRILSLMKSDQPASILELKRLIERGAIGVKLLEGWRVSISGRPNVGKSRLLNAILGLTRAIVAPVPGTTRDVVTSRTAIGGWPIELADTAGIRQTEDLLEAAGVQRALQERERSDLILLVLDGSEPLTESDWGLIKQTPSSGRLLVRNKSDLQSAWSEIGVHEPLIELSAETGDGLDQLLSSIAQSIVPETPDPREGVPFRSNQVRALQRARRLLEGGRIESSSRLLSRLRIRGY